MLCIVQGSCGVRNGQDRRASAEKLIVRVRPIRGHIGFGRDSAAVKPVWLSKKGSVGHLEKAKQGLRIGRIVYRDSSMTSIDGDENLTCNKMGHRPTLHTAVHIHIGRP